jgi:hypothetical protein
MRLAEKLDWKGLIQGLGATDSVLLLLQANDGHSESIVILTFHLYVLSF